jgi:hypothetical protein
MEIMAGSESLLLQVNPEVNPQVNSQRYIALVANRRSTN